MKKVTIAIIFACSMIISCKKDTASIPGIPPTGNSTIQVVSLTSDNIVGIDLAGFPILNLSRGTILRAISGTIVLNMTLHGILKSLGIYNFSFRDDRGIFYQEIYETNIETMWSDGQCNFYKFSCKPIYNSGDYTLNALVKVTCIANDRYQVELGSGALDYH